MNNFLIAGIVALIGIAIFIWIISSARKLSEGGIGNGKKKRN